MCFAATGRLQGRAAKLLLVRWQSPGILHVRCKFALQLTARRYNLVGVSRRKHRAEFWYPAPAGPINCHGARRLWRTFCRPGTSFYEGYVCRGTSLIGAENLSPVTYLVGSTGAVSRHKVDRSQKTVKVYRILIASRCAYPGVGTITKLSCG